MISQIIPHSDTWFGIHPPFGCCRALSYTFGVTYGHDTPRSQQPRCSPGILVHAALWSLKSRHPKDQTYSDPCQNGSITNLTSVHPQVSKGLCFWPMLICGKAILVREICYDLLISTWLALGDFAHNVEVDKSMHPLADTLFGPQSPTVLTVILTRWNDSVR